MAKFLHCRDHVGRTHSRNESQSWMQSCGEISRGRRKSRQCLMVFAGHAPLRQSERGQIAGATEEGVSTLGGAHSEILLPAHIAISYSGGTRLDAQTLQLSASGDAPINSYRNDNRRPSVPEAYQSRSKFSVRCQYSSARPCGQPSCRHRT
jgi:hypothetical protein